MADTKVSALTAATSALSTHEFLVNEAGASKKVTGQQILDLTGDSVSSVPATGNQTVVATTAVLTGSAMTIPAAKLRIGTTFIWRIVMQKTAAGTATNTFAFQLGTAGTTADADIIAFGGTGTGTAAADTANVDLMVTIRGPLSASCVAVGQMRWSRQTITAAGFAATTQQTFVLSPVVSSTFDATTSGLIASIAVTAATGTTLNFPIVLGEAKYL